MNRETNWETTNVDLWISNDEMMYLSARAFVRRRGHLFGAYKAFITYMGLENENTPDGAPWIYRMHNYHVLDEMMLDLVEWNKKK